MLQSLFLAAFNYPTTDKIKDTICNALNFSFPSDSQSTCITRKKNLVHLERIFYVTGGKQYNCKSDLEEVGKIVNVEVYLMPFFSF